MSNLKRHHTWKVLEKATSIYTFTLVHKYTLAHKGTYTLERIDA